MQKLIKLLALFILVSFAASTYAQSIGPKAGVNIASFTGDDSFDEDGNTSTIGLQFGAVVEIPVSDKFSIQPELVYLQKGAGTEFDVFGTKVETDFKLNYFEIPILAKVYLTEGPTQVFVNVGPSIGFGLGGKTVTKAGDEEEEEDIDFSDDELTSLDLSLAVGAGVQFDAGPGKLFIDVRYLLGLTSLDDSEEPIDVLNRGIGASVGFLFPIGQ